MPGISVWNSQAGTNYAEIQIDRDSFNYDYMANDFLIAYNANSAPTTSSPTIDIMSTGTISGGGSTSDVTYYMAPRFGNAIGNSISHTFLAQPLLSISLSGENMFYSVTNSSRSILTNLYVSTDAYPTSGFTHTNITPNSGASGLSYNIPNGTYTYYARGENLSGYETFTAISNQLVVNLNTDTPILRVDGIMLNGTNYYIDYNLENDDSHSATLYGRIGSSPGSSSTYSLGTVSSGDIEYSSSNTNSRIAGTYSVTTRQSRSFTIYGTALQSGRNVSSATTSTDSPWGYDATDWVLQGTYYYLPTHDVYTTGATIQSEAGALFALNRAYPAGQAALGALGVVLGAGSIYYRFVAVNG